MRVNFRGNPFYFWICIHCSLSLLPKASLYNKTSDRGHSEKGQTSLQRTIFLYTPYKITFEKEQPLYIEDKKLGPEHVHYSEVSLYSNSY